MEENLFGLEGFGVEGQAAVIPRVLADAVGRKAQLLVQGGHGQGKGGGLAVHRGLRRNAPSVKVAPFG